MRLLAWWFFNGCGSYDQQYCTVEDSGRRETHKIMLRSSCLLSNENGVLSIGSCGERCTRTVRESQISRSLSLQQQEGV